MDVLEEEKAKIGIKGGKEKGVRRGFWGEFSLNQRWGSWYLLVAVVGVVVDTIFFMYSQTMFRLYSNVLELRMT